MVRHVAYEYNIKEILQELFNICTEQRINYKTLDKTYGIFIEKHIATYITKDLVCFSRITNNKNLISYEYDIFIWVLNNTENFYHFLNVRSINKLIEIINNNT